MVTTHGTVRAEHVVNAGGLWAREVGRMVGLELPVLAMEHQYLITEDLPELAGQKELLHCIDFEGEIYMRQERGGMLLGTYERAGVPWSPKVTPWDFGQDLLPNDLERIAPSLEVAFQHFPRLGEVGVRRVVNGPFTFAPDGNPLVGPIAGLRNYWVACGVMAGFSQGGGVGLTLANWMIEGDPGADVWAMDVARYGEWATPPVHQCQGARELFTPLPHPLPERGAGCRAAAAHHADPRAAAGRECRVRRLLRPGARAVVCAEGQRAARGRHLPPLQRACARRRRMSRRARQRRPDRDQQLRQVRGGRVCAPSTG